MPAAARRHLRLFVLLLVAALWTAPAARAESAAVDIELVLAVDVSRSIDDDEYALQKRGYAEAFVNPAVLNAIRANPHQRIAVTLVEWAGSDFQKVVVPWTMISDEESGKLFSEAIIQSSRSFWGWTSISGAIDASVPLFGHGYEGTRKVIDVSGDGVNNSGRPASMARDEALARGITINGLVIMNDKPNPGFVQRPQPPLDEFYRDNVIGGPGAFLVAIDDFESFAFAIVNKLVKEIASLPPGNGLSVAELKRR
ncbi:MAG TPA: DUF1194 domain-containing protein [Alphaproteobacteria bacterium]